MKKLRLIIIINFIGWVILFCLFLFYQSFSDHNASSKAIISHREIKIDEKDLKEKLRLCSLEELQKMYAAGKDLQEWMGLLEKSGSHIVKEVLDGQRAFYEIVHYPLQDIFDRETFSQYFYHAHRRKEHGHFHLFLRQGGMRKNKAPLFYDEQNQTLNDFNTFAHIVAISMDDEGYPIGLFMTNRWVTEEDWYKGDDVKKMVEHFYVGQTAPFYVVSRWLNAMLILFKPQILHLIDRRDQVLLEHCKDSPLKELLEDHDLDILSESRISIDLQMRVIETLLKEESFGLEDL